jgi:hypothetical protein
MRSLVRSFAVLVLGVCLSTGLLGCGRADRAAAPEPPAAVQNVAPAVGAAGEPRPTQANVAARRQLLEVKVEYEVVLAKAEATAATLDRLERGAYDRGGFVASRSVGQDGVSRLTLRVPTADIETVRSTLRQSGTVVKEQQTATDVTDAIADVEARLKVAKAEETRLLKLLEERAGSMSDVLAVEKALADVRDRIERLEATQRVSMQRVELATVDVVVRPPQAIVAEPTLGQRLGESAKTGVHAAEAVAIGIVHAALVAGPTLLMFSLLGLGVAAVVRRLARKRLSGSATLTA